MSKYRKFLVALGGAFGVAASALADGSISGQEVAAFILALAGAVLVYVIPNTEG